MHIPDGFINLATSAGAGVTAAGGLGAVLHRVRTTLSERQIPLAGLAAAFIFVVQMLNFPVAAGTSGHLLGGALVAILLGPWVGAIVISVVLLLQALLFADGGISALGLNVVNMALIGVFVAWLVFRLLTALLPRTGAVLVGAAAVASWVSVVAASGGFVLEYAWGGTGNAPVSTVFAAMVGVHALIGIGEGLITASVLAAVLAVRPDLVYGARLLGVRRAVVVRADRRATATFVLAGIAAALLLVVVVAPHASSSPDGLERVASDHGFAWTGQTSAAAGSPLAHYSVAGVPDAGVGTILAGAIGLVLTFAVGALVLHISARRGASRSTDDAVHR